MADVRLLGFFAVLILAATSRAATRIAILATGSDAQAGNVAAITEATLSQGDDFTVLERQQIDRILAEQKLSLSGLVEADQAVKVGKVLSCQMLAILEPETGSSQFGLVIFDPATGVRLTDFLISGEPADAAKAVITAIRMADQKRRSPAQVHTLCLLSVRNADLPRDMDGFCDAVGRMLERSLIGSSSIAVLDRTRLEQVTRERALVSEIATQRLLASVVVIDLQFERHLQGIQVTALLSDTAGKETGKVIAALSSVDVSKTATAVADALTGSLKVPEAPRLDLLAEAARFHNEWDFRTHNEDYFRALAPAEAAHALAPDNLLYHAALAEALIEQGQAQYRGPAFTPHSATKPWERHDLVPVSLLRGAQMLADIQPRASQLKDSDRVAVEGHFETAATVLRYFIASATWFQANQTNRTPLPSSEVAAVKRSLRQYLLREDADLLAAVKDGGAFKAYCAHLPQLLSDNQWLYSVDPDQWTEDFQRSARTWLSLRRQYPDVASQEVVDAFDAITVGWQFETHQGTKVYGGGVNDRLCRWDPTINGRERFSSLKRILDSDPAPTVRWYGELLGLSIEITPEFNSPDRIHQSVGQFIDKMIPLLATPDLAHRQDLRQTLYHLLIQADRLLDKTQWKGDFNRRLFDLSLSRHEVVPNIVSRSASPWINAKKDGSDTERQIALYERVLKAMEFDDRVIFGFENELIARTVYLQELQRLRHLQESTVTPSTRPWYQSRQLIDVFQASTGSRAIFGPIIDGDYVDVLGAQPMSDQIQAVRLELLRFPLAGGPPQRLGMLPTQELLNLQTDNFTIGTSSVMASCLAQGLYCASTRRDGIMIFPTDGHFPKRLGLSDGLPDIHAGAISLMDGQLFAALGVDRAERYLISYDLANKQVDAIFSSSRKQKRSPFDDQTGIQVVSLTADPARYRLIAVIMASGKQPQLNGLWEYRPATRQWRFVLPVHVVFGVNGNRTTAITTVLPPRNDVILFANGGAVLLFDLRSDRAFTLSKLDGPDPVLPSQTPLWNATAAGVEALQHIPVGVSVRPRALIDPWLWGDWGRINLLTGELQNLEHLRAPAQPSYGRLDIEPIGDGKKLLICDQMGLWVVSASP